MRGNAKSRIGCQGPWQLLGIRAHVAEHEACDHKAYRPTADQQEFTSVYHILPPFIITHSTHVVAQGRCHAPPPRSNALGHGNQTGQSNAYEAVCHPKRTCTEQTWQSIAQVTVAGA